MLCPFLTGETIYLTAPRIEDAEIYRHWLADPETRNMLYHRHPLSPTQAARYYAEVNNDPDSEIALAIRLKADDQLAGNVSLRNIVTLDRSAEFGIYVGDKSLRGMGIGTQATRLMIDYAFGTLNLNRVWLTVATINPAAIRCYEKAGFQAEGTLRKSRFVDGEYVDETIMSILRRDWLK